MAISTAIDASAVARVLGIKTIYEDLRGANVVLLPQRVALVGQGATASTYSTTKAQVTSAQEVATNYGFGSPLHLAALQLLPANGDGIGTIPLTVYPLVDDGSGVVSAGDITPSGAVTKAGSFIVRINNIDSASFVVSVGDAVATIITNIATAVAAELNLPMLGVDNTTVFDLTSKWAGTSANDLFIEVVGPTDTGVSFAITQPVGGLVNPDIDAALAQVGGVWETVILNCLDIADTATLDKYQVFGDGRWGAIVKKPLGVFTGNTATTVSAATAVSDTRKPDRTNGQLVAPGSKDLPFVVAARELAPIVVLANNNPAHDYGSQPATGLTPGTDGEQWTYTQRDAAVKAGSSTIEVKDGVINVSDTVTFYHPTGDPNPAFRFFVDIVKLQNIIFNFDLRFATDEWDGAPLIPDDQYTTNRSAKKPRTAVTVANTVIDALAAEALISDPKTAKANTIAEIDGANPKRLNLSVTIQLVGNSNIISMDLNFGFFFGQSTLAA